MEVKAKLVSNNWECIFSQIHKINEGKVLALELDPENNMETDSIFTYDRDLVEERPQVLNKLYVVDDHEDVHLLVQE